MAKDAKERGPGEWIPQESALGVEDAYELRVLVLEEDAHGRLRRRRVQYLPHPGAHLGHGCLEVGRDRDRRGGVPQRVPVRGSALVPFDALEQSPQGDHSSEVLGVNAVHQRLLDGCHELLRVHPEAAPVLLERHEQRAGATGRRLSAPFQVALDRPERLLQASEEPRHRGVHRGWPPRADSCQGAPPARTGGRPSAGREKKEREPPTADPGKSSCHGMGEWWEGRGTKEGEGTLVPSLRKVPARLRPPVPSCRTRTGQGQVGDVRRRQGSPSSATGFA